jgi:hypothetical protein
LDRTERKVRPLLLLVLHALGGLALAGGAAGQESRWAPGKFGFPVHNPAPFVVHHVRSAQGIGYPAAAAIDPGVRFGDVNGDGRVDLVRAGAYYPAGQSHRVYTNTGSAWRVDHTWTVKTLSEIRAPGFRSVRGAGCGVAPGGAREPVYFARPLAYTAPQAWNDRNGLALPPQNAQLGDVNGDGFADVVYAYQVGPTFCAGRDPAQALPAQRVAGVWLNDQHGRWVENPALSGSLKTAGPVFVVSGLEQAVDATGAWSAECPNGVPPETRSFRRISAAGPCEFAYTYEMGTRLVDLDGDGRLDLISETAGPFAALHAQTRSQLASSVGNGAWLNRGDRFEPAPAWRSPVPIAARHSGVPVDTGVRFADLDGDGRADLIQGGARLASHQDADPSHFWPHRVFLNRPGGWCDAGAAGSPCAEARRWLPPVDFVREISAGESHTGDPSRLQTIGENGVRLADLDGDGRADLLRAAPGDGGRRAWLNRPGPSAEPASAWAEAPELAPPAGMEFTAEELAPAPSGAGRLRVELDRGVRLLDVDGNGTPDLVRSSTRDGEGVMLLRRAAGAPPVDAAGKR